MKKKEKVSLIALGSVLAITLTCNQILPANESKVSKNSFTSTVYANQTENRIIKVSNLDELIKACKNPINGDIITLTDNISYDSTLTFSIWGGRVTLDLNGYTLEIINPHSNAINISGWSNEVVVTNSKTTGFLYAECTMNNYDESKSDNDYTAIKVSNNDQTFIVDNAKIIAIGGYNSAGIGSHLEETGNIIIESGHVIAQGGIYGAGIGGGFNKDSGSILVQGGIVESTGGMGGAGIGSGGFISNSDDESKSSSKNSIIISNGQVLATGGAGASGIGGGIGKYNENISILNGRVDAIGGENGSGIGSGSLASLKADDLDLKDLLGGTIEIYGGHITSTGGYNGAGIGLGQGLSDYSSENFALGRNINLYGGYINAIGGCNGAGVGGGAYLSGGIINIGYESGENLQLTSVGGDNASGIGGGLSGLSGENLSVFNGDIIATGGYNGSGIGSGGFLETQMEPTNSLFQAMKNINLFGGNITINSGENASAIGGGVRGSGSNVLIGENSIITANTSSKYSIGAGLYSNSHGNIEINGGNLKTNGELGVIPTNKDNQELFPVSLSVYYNDEETPIKSAVVKGVTMNNNSYNSITDENGEALVYLPKESEPIKATANYSNFSVFKEIDVDTSDNFFALTGYEPLILSSNEVNYYINSYPNELVIYENNPLQIDTFKITDSASPLSIDEATGTITVPLDITANTYPITVESYNNNQLVQRDYITVNVKNQLEDIFVESNYLTGNIGEPLEVIVEAIPNNTDLYYLTGELTSDIITDAKGEITKEISDDNRSGKFTFIPYNSGNYALTIAGSDENGNTSTKVINISVGENSDDNEAVAVSNTTNNSYVIAENPPKILSWDIARHNELSSTLTLNTSESGTYYYKLVETEFPKDEIMTTGNFLSKGTNEIVFDDLENVDYTCYVKIVDNINRESNEIAINIPKFIANDIIPPTLSNANYSRLNDEEIEISFNANEGNNYYYSLTESENPSFTDFKNSYKTTVNGINKVTLNGIYENNNKDLYICAVDLAGNISEYLKFDISNKVIENDYLTEILEDGFVDNVYSEEFSEDLYIIVDDVRRIGENSAVINFRVDEVGVYSYYVVENNNVSTVSSSNDKNIAKLQNSVTLKKGSNQIIVNDLNPSTSYDIVIKKDEVAGRSIHIEAFENPLIIAEDYVSRKSINKATIDFTSNNYGTFKYAVVENDNYSDLVFSDDFYMHEGVNSFDVNNLFTSSAYIFYIVGEDKNGNLSNQLLIELDSYDIYTKELSEYDSNKIYIY